MRLKISCQEAKIELTQLQGKLPVLKKMIAAAINPLSTPKEIDIALKFGKDVQIELQTGIKELKDKVENKVEKLLNIREQYTNQLKIHRETGVIQRLSNGKEGIIGISGHGKEVEEYAIPTLEEVYERLESLEQEYGEGFLAKKKEQGFGRFLLVPFGWPLFALIDRYSQALLKHAKEGKLFYPKKDPHDVTELQVAVDLDTDSRIFASHEYINADTKLVYNVEQFDSENHGGKTKQKILEENSQTAWKILLVEDEVNIPREGKGKIIGGRLQVEAGKSADEYLEFILEQSKDPNSPYYGEKGLTPEDWLMLAITELEQKNQVTDDSDDSAGNGSASYNIGAYFLESSYVPYSDFNRRDRKTYLNCLYPVHCVDKIGLRFAVSG